MGNNIADMDPLAASPDKAVRAKCESSSHQVSRRGVLGLAAGSGAFAFSIWGPGTSAVHAKQASPEPSESKTGLYVVVRSRTVKADASIDELNTAIESELVPLIAAIPGFVEYYVVQNMNTRERTAVSIFEDKDGADASTTIATDFLREQGLAEFYEDVEPVVVEGDIVVARSTS